MKNLTQILMIVFAFTLTINAQKKGGKPSADKMLTRMTKELTLSNVQQQKIKPLLEAEIVDRQVMMEKRKAMKEAGKKPSKEERKKINQNRIAKKTAMLNEMKNILTPNQFLKYTANLEKRKQKTKEKNNQ